MKHPSPLDETPDDPELLREVYKALKTCGWLPPETLEEVRRVEKELEDNPVEFPEELLDPSSIFDAFSDNRPEDVPPTSIPPNLSAYPPMSGGLTRLVHEEGLEPAQVVTLIGFHGQLLFNRSEGRGDETSYEDWKRFYLEVRDCL